MQAIQRSASCSTSSSSGVAGSGSSSSSGRLLVGGGRQHGGSSRCSVIAMAKPTRAADFRGLDSPELLQKVAELKREHLRLEYMQRTRGNTINPGAEANPEAVAPKPHEFHAVRRQIAQLLTLLREREIADGVSRKDSRRFRKEAKVAAGFGQL